MSQNDAESRLTCLVPYTGHVCEESFVKYFLQSLEGDQHEFDLTAELFLQCAKEFRQHKQAGRVAAEALRTELLETAEALQQEHEQLKTKLEDIETASRPSQAYKNRCAYLSCLKPLMHSTCSVTKSESICFNYSHPADD